MQLNYDWAALHVSTEPGLKCSNESNQAFFPSEVRFECRCLQSAADVNTEDVSSIFILCSPRRGGSLAFCPARLRICRVLITNRTSVERHFNVMGFFVCPNLTCCDG